MNTYDKVVFQSLGNVKTKYLWQLIEWQTLVLAYIRGVEQKDIMEAYSIDKNDNDVILRSKIRNMQAAIVEIREKCKDNLY